MKEEAASLNAQHLLVTALIPFRDIERSDLTFEPVLINIEYWAAWPAQRPPNFTVIGAHCSQVWLVEKW